MPKVRKSVYEGGHSFIGDEEKMHDFMIMDMVQFLSFYSYLSVEDYLATYDELMDLISTGVGWQCRM